MYLARNIKSATKLNPEKQTLRNLGYPLDAYIEPTPQTKRRWTSKEQVWARIKELERQRPIRTFPTLYALKHCKERDKRIIQKASMKNYDHSTKRWK